MQHDGHSTKHTLWHEVRNAMPGKWPLKNSSTVSDGEGAQEIYRLLLASSRSTGNLAAARDFLEAQLRRAAELPQPVPEDPEQLAPWLENNIAEVGSAYSRYLDSRKRGEPREYFTSRSHALSFLRGVAPTKLVDGAWLYGTVHHWTDLRFYPLIRTYLEELGDGDPARNHVALYQRLLTENDCADIPALSDQHYVQGALQLALAYLADDFMPEVIGYNLGYEQLPLHLLITAFELGELDIDPYYFTLHVTIDNASSGHARKAVMSLTNCLPAVGSPASFMQRVSNGYRLNYLGLGTLDVIGAFDLEIELINALERKCRFGQNLHSDFCRIDGRTINEWLSQPDQMRSFLRTLESSGWIRRNENLDNSRFWRLVEGPDAKMAGVFSKFEKQLLRDWIAGTTGTQVTDEAAVQDLYSRSQSSPFRRYRKTMLNADLQRAPAAPGDLDQDVLNLKQELQHLTESAKVQRLIELMNPSQHFTAAGLFATREFARLV